MKLLLFVTLITALFQVGCATEAKFAEKMDSWVGHGIDDVMMKYGPPQNTTEMSNGNKIYQYHFSNGVAASYSYGNAYANEIYCNVNFYVEKTVQIITNWQATGNACRSR